MNTIVCPIGLFTYNQKIYLADENDNLKDIGSYPVDDLGARIAELAQVCETNKIRLVGDPIYCESLISDIITFSSKNYGLKIEDYDITVN